MSWGTKILFQWSGYFFMFFIYDRNIGNLDLYRRASVSVCHNWFCIAFYNLLCLSYGLAIADIICIQIIYFQRSHVGAQILYLEIHIFI